MAGLLEWIPRDDICLDFCCRPGATEHVAGRPRHLRRINFPDVVMTYDLTRRLPMATALTPEAGKRGKRFTFSPDGQQVAFLTWKRSRREYLFFSCRAAFPKPEAAYSMKGNPVDLSLSPKPLDLVCRNQRPGIRNHRTGSVVFRPPIPAKSCRTELTPTRCWEVSTDYCSLPAADTCW